MLIMPENPSQGASARMGWAEESWHSPGASRVPGKVLAALCLFIHLILPTLQEGSYCHYHFVGKNKNKNKHRKTEDQGVS